MPVAITDAFRRIIVKPDDITVEAEEVGDTLTLVAGSGISLVADASSDQITITNSASLGFVTLDNVLLAGNSSSRTATVGRLNVDSIVIDSNAIQFSDSTSQTTAWTGLTSATSSALGGVIIPVVGTSGITNSSGTIGLATASNTQLGGVKVDASSITINGSGVISVPAVATLGQTNGIATLGADGKLTSDQIPTSLSGAIVFKGTWDASTNSPTLVDGTGQNGWQYAVAVAGTVNLGSGNLSFVPGDFIIYNGSIWQKIAANTIAAAGTLTGSTLASGVTASSLTSVGTIGTGIWQGTIVAGQYGGTGINNSGKTITLGGNLTTSGAFATTLTSTATTSVTLPTTGTLATLTGSETLTNKTISGSSNTLSNIANASLTNSSVTVGTTSISLGASATTLSGLSSVSSTSFVGALTGNADTVTNGVYTNGSYADPAWITSLAASKVGLGSVTNESKATMFASPTFTGTVSGVTATHVGLGNVTNESKATMFASPTFTGTVTGVTATHVGLGNVTNESKATMFASPTFTGTVTGVTATHVGLGSVENTALSTWGGSTSITSLGTVTVGSAPAGDVYAWAKAATKPSYTATEVGLGNVTNESKATMFTAPSFTLSGNVGINVTNEGGWPAGMVFKGSGGTIASPTQTGNGTSVLNIRAQGHIGSGGAGVFTTLGWIEWAATEAITSDNRGSQLGLYANRAGGAASYGLFWNGTIFDTTQGSIKATGITTGGSTTAGTLTGAWTLTGSISGVTATMVGLGNVTNESKATMFSSPTFTGTVTGVTATHVGLGNVTNESKATMFASPTFTGTVSGVTATHVGLGSVTNESKATMFSSPTFTGTVSGVTATHVGLGSVTNESKATMFSSPTFTGTVSGVTATHVGLGSVTNESKATMFSSPTFTGTVSGVTATHVGLSNVGNYTVNQNVGTANDVTHNTVTATAFYYSSDATLKTNIGTLTNYWETLDALRPVSFDWISSGKKDLGLLAQDVQSVMPESVTTTNNGTLAISSSGIIANLVAAVKDLKQQVEELTKQLKG